MSAMWMKVKIPPVFIVTHHIGLVSLLPKPIHRTLVKNPKIILLLIALGLPQLNSFLFLYVNPLLAVTLSFRVLLMLIAD